MRKLAVAAVAAFTMVAVATPADGATGSDKRAAKVYVPCYHYWNQTVVYKKRPDRCDFGPDGCPAALCVDPFKSINWNRYGGKTASGKGRPWVNGPGWIDPIKFKLSNVRDPKCGPPIYTKISYQIGGSFRLARCR